MVKGMSVDRCVRNAKDFIKNQGACLLLFDVKKSESFKNSSELVNSLLSMMEDINQEFGGFFPENNLAVYSRKEKGFQFLLGDGSWAGINRPDIIPRVIEYQKNKYPDIPLYWSVARDGYDKENVKIVK